MITEYTEIINSDIYYKNEYYEIAVYNEIFYTRYLTDMLDLKVAKLITFDRERLSNNQKLVTLTDSRNVRYYTKEARAFHSTPENYKFMKAGAIIYTKSHVATVIINFFMRFNPPPIPARFFTDEREALEWVQKYK